VTPLNIDKSKENLSKPHIMSARQNEDVCNNNEKLSVEMSCCKEKCAIF